MLIGQTLENAARSLPHKPAVWFKGSWKTYEELNRSADRIAAYLVTLGVRPGERVALLLENSFDYIAAHFGVLKTGAVEVSLNTELKPDGLRQLLMDCDAVVLIAGVKFAGAWRSIIDSLPELRQLILDQMPEKTLHPNCSISVHLLPDILQSEQLRAAVSGRIDLDLASIVYTSGVTGKAKGVMLSHMNLVSNTRSIVQYLELCSDDRMMVVLPFYYIYGRSLLYSHFLSGGSLVLDNAFAYPAKVLGTMREQEVTGFAGVPSTFAILLKNSDVKRCKFPSLRLVTQAGGGMAPALQKEAAEAFHPARLFVMYGSTEASPRLTYVPPEMLPFKFGSIGHAIPNVEVAVADEHGNKLPPGVTGEIVARGSNIMMGYWRDAAGTAQVLRNGYYYTGDLGYADEDGYLFLTGRSRDMIKTGGNRVSSKEIEDVLAEIPGVLESAVIGIPDEILGEAIKAFIVPSASTLNPDNVRSHLLSRLPAFKQPKWLEFRECLPKAESGKVLKSLLRNVSQ